MLLTTFTMAFTAKVEKPASVKGTSIGKYANPVLLWILAMKHNM